MLQSHRIFAPQGSRWCRTRVSRGGENTSLVSLRPRQDDVRFSSSPPAGRFPNCPEVRRNDRKTPGGVGPQTFPEVPREGTDELGIRRIHDYPKGDRKADRRSVFSLKQIIYVQTNYSADGLAPPDPSVQLKYSQPQKITRSHGD